MPEKKVRPRKQNSSGSPLFLILVYGLILACDRFGTSGSLGIPAGQCLDNANQGNTSDCTALPNRYVTTHRGAALSEWSNPTHSTTIGGVIPTGFYDIQQISFMDPNLVSGNIKYGLNIFSVPGFFIGQDKAVSSLRSNMHHSAGVLQLSQSEETSVASPYPIDSAGYRAIPIFADSILINVVAVSRLNWDNHCDSSTGHAGGTANSQCTCGLSGTLEARIADCAAHAVIGPNATWNGHLLGLSGEGQWKLVTRSTFDHPFIIRTKTEVWRDESTQLLWSSLMSSFLNWCQASGSNQIPGNPTAEDDPFDICDLSNIAYGSQTNEGLAWSACFEDGEVNFTSNFDGNYSAGKGGLNLNSTPSVQWRLPTIYDYYQALINGFSYVLPDANLTPEWSATISAIDRSSAYYYMAYSLETRLSSRYNIQGVRCVGR